MQICWFVMHCLYYIIICGPRGPPRNTILMSFFWSFMTQGERLKKDCCLCVDGVPVDLTPRLSSHLIQIRLAVDVASKPANLCRPAALVNFASSSPSALRRKTEHCADMGKGKGGRKAAAKAGRAFAHRKSKQPLNRPTYRYPYNNEKWMLRYEELKNYRSLHGHCRVPAKSSKLAFWVERQRLLFKLRNAGKQSSMTDERIDLLRKIDFEWRIDTKDHAKWRMRFEEAKAHLLEHGHLVVPPSQLQRWIRNQRNKRGRQWEVDAEFGGNEMRYINCILGEEEANVGAFCEKRGEDTHVVIRAIKDIYEDEELLWDYGPDYPSFP